MKIHICDFGHFICYNIPMTLFSGSPLGNSLLDLCMLEEEEAPPPLSMQSDIEVKGESAS